MKIISKKLNQSGFTLVEIVVVIIISGIMMVGLSSTVVSIRLVNARAIDSALVNSIVEDKVEELRSQTYVSLSDGTYDFTSELPATINENRSAEYTITTVSGNAALKEVDFIVTYNDFNNSAVYEYKTYIGELGVGQY